MKINRTVPFLDVIIAYPGGNKKILGDIIDDTAGCKVETGCDGNWRVTNLIKKLIENQYPTQ